VPAGDALPAGQFFKFRFAAGFELSAGHARQLRRLRGTGARLVIPGPSL
jgi:hypothetical protein